MTTMMMMMTMVMRIVMDGDNADVQVEGLGLHSTLYIMWPGLVAASGALFLVARCTSFSSDGTWLSISMRSERKGRVLLSWEFY